MSIIVADNNLRARQLYARHGYVERLSRPMVKEDWVSRGDRWVLMTTSLAG
jgi:hypothetical protein